MDAYAFDTLHLRELRYCVAGGFIPQGTEFVEEGEVGRRPALRGGVAREKMGKLLSGTFCLTWGEWGILLRGKTPVKRLLKKPFLHSSGGVKGTVEQPFNVIARSPLAKGGETKQ
ncbi:MAG: hypothetical protein ACE5K2_02115 [Candidatus Zixiibacteriota bacterium]